MIRALLILFTLLVGIPAGALAQKVETGFIPKQIKLGAQTYFIIKVTDAVPQQIPIDIRVDGLEIEYGGKNYRMQADGGRQSTETTYTYLVNPLRAGTFTIPSFDILLNGTPTKSPSATIRVGEPTAAEAAQAKVASRPYFLQLNSEKKSAYPNELIPMSLEIFVRKPKAITEVGQIELEDERFVFQRFKLVERRMDAEISGLQFSKVQLNGAAFAFEGTPPGTVKIGPAAMTVMIENSRTGFRFGIFSSADNIQMQSEPLEIELKAFPTEGKPANFTGTVGSFEMEAKASLAQLTVGDPISIDIDITGPGNYETLNAPTFLSTDETLWRTYDARKFLDPTEDSDGESEGKATFTQIIIPQDELKEIPPFELVAFNPVTETYDIIRTDPIPINVAPDPTSVTAVAPGMTLTPGGGFAAGSAAAAQPAASYSDIIAFSPEPPTWRDARPILRSPFFWVTQGVALLVVCTLLGIGIARATSLGRRNRKEKKGELTFNVLKAQISQTKNHRGEFYRVVSEALEAWRRERGRDAPNLSESDRTLVEALEARCNWLLYGASSSDRQVPPAEHEVREAIQIIEGLS